MNEPMFIDCPYTGFIPKWYFLLDIVNTVDGALITGDFNIHKDDENDSFS